MLHLVYHKINGFQQCFSFLIYSDKLFILKNSQIISILPKQVYAYKATTFCQ